jgi:hypothetical protein
MIVIGDPLVLANNHHTNSCDHRYGPVALLDAAIHDQLGLQLEPGKDSCHRSH